MASTVAPVTPRRFSAFNVRPIAAAPSFSVMARGAPSPGSMRRVASIAGAPGAGPSTAGRVRRARLRRQRLGDDLDAGAHVTLHRFPRSARSSRPAPAPAAPAAAARDRRDEGLRQRHQRGARPAGSRAAGPGPRAAAPRRGRRARRRRAAGAAAPALRPRSARATYGVAPTMNGSASAQVRHEHDHPGQARAGRHVPARRHGRRATRADSTAHPPRRRSRSTSTIRRSRCGRGAPRRAQRRRVPQPSTDEP